MQKSTEAVIPQLKHPPHRPKEMLHLASCRTVLHMKHPAERVTMVRGRGEPNSLPGSGLDYSRKVHELED